MAKSSKGKTRKSKINKEVVDAVEVDAQSADDATALEDIAEANVVETVSTDVQDVVEAEVFSDSAETVAAEDVPDDEDGLNLDAEVVDDEITDPIEGTLPDQVESEPVPAESKSSGGFVPLAFGGLVAGAIGYGVATFFPLNMGSQGLDDLNAQLTAQSDQIAALEQQIADMPTPEMPDLSGIETQIADVETQALSAIGALTTSVEEQVAALDARIVEVEKAPNADGTLSETALAAYQQELDDLRAELGAQQENVMSAAAQAEADLAAARAEAEKLEQEAIATAEAAAARAALNRVATAVETGAPFADALADLGAADVPAALTDAAENGVATTAQLTGDFPAVARAALATARSEGASDDAGGLGGFFRSQFDVRSTAPQEGSGPDAVLSRAEAAVKEGRIADALAEIEALPEVARAEMTDWTARATARSDALDAITTLSESFN